MTAKKITAEIAARLRALREALDMDERTMSEKTGVDVGLLQKYESGQVDIPVGFLTEVAHVCGTDLTALLTGREGHLRAYSLVKKGEGLSAQRHPAYEYFRLAHRFSMPGMEPFMVTVPWEPDSAERKLSQHRGEEFVYLVKGRLEVRLGLDVVVMAPGDSLYFDSATPHSMRGLDGEPATFLDVIL